MNARDRLRLHAALLLPILALALAGPATGLESTCNDGLDDDGDLRTDCDDTDCATHAACTSATGNLTVQQPGNYPVAAQSVGSAYYIDRSYTLTSIPSALAGVRWIRPANADKNNTSSNFLRFRLARTSRVWVAYDRHALSLPNWLSASFGPTGQSLGVSDPDQVTLDLYAVQLPAGVYTLGGNKAAGASFAAGVGSTNYLVAARALELCSDSLDNDLDGQIDCADADCSATPTCPGGGTETICNDGLDNDQDGKTDCTDPDCGADPACQASSSESICNDGVDNDQDGQTDCDDLECVPGAVCAGNTTTVLQPSGYPVQSLGTGGTYYNDRSYTLVSIPSDLQGAEWIRTANDDKNNTSSSYLRFRLTRTSRVWIAYDPRALSVPNWLSALGFTLTSETVTVSDGGLHFRLYVAELAPGSYTLGGNKAPGASFPAGVGSANYLVIVRPLELCDDALDNDRDGAVDCFDSDCDFEAPCRVATEICDDGDDDDADGATDCADSECAYDPTCNADTFFFDDFSDGSADGWSAIDQTPKAASWGVEDGRLVQTQNKLAGYAGTSSNHLGSYAYLTSGLGTGNYVVSARLVPLGRNSGDDVGLLFRYQNDNNHYRITFNSEWSFTRVEKVVGGAFSTLAVSARSFSPDAVLHVVVEVEGDQILIRVDGDPLFALRDGSLATGTIGLFTRRRAAFDDVAVALPDTSPHTAIGTPLAHSARSGGVVDVSALAKRVPSNGAVQLVLDPGTPGAVSVIRDCTAAGCAAGGYSGWFNTSFSGVATGNHVVRATILDSADHPVPGAAGRDDNVTVGVRGEELVSMGDSITFGENDEFHTDNTSALGRVLGRNGFQAMLTDLLDAALGKPHLVFNQGIPGDDTAEALDRLGSVLSRYPDADRLTVLLGTNDSGSTLPLPSGLGCSGSSCNGTFKGNMQTLIDTIRAAGPDVVVAEVPPAFGACSTCTPFVNPATASRNVNFIAKYNQVIRTELTGIDVGPDFYDYFLNRFSLFSDNLHPNSLGYRIMAHLWRDALAGPAALPFFLDSLAPAGYKQNLIEVGNRPYLDRTHTITRIPADLAGPDTVWLLVRNDDRDVTSASWISFSTGVPVTVVVAYDPRATSRPNWLTSAFTARGDDIGLSDTGSPTMPLYSANLGPGTITLGGNKASGAVFPSGVSGNHYLVMVKRR